MPRSATALLTGVHRVHSKTTDAAGNEDRPPVEGGYDQVKKV